MAHLGRKLADQLLDNICADGPQPRHDEGEFLDLLVVHHGEDFGRAVFADGQQQNGRLLGTGQRAIIVDLAGFRHCGTILREFHRLGKSRAENLAFRRNSPKWRGEQASLPTGSP